MSADTMRTAQQTDGQGGSARDGQALRMTWLVARREIRLRAKTRVFVITTAIMLIAVALAVALPAILSGKSKPERIGVVGGDTTTLSSIVTELTGDSPTDDIALIGLRWLN